ncbi:MAG TPA: energy transducer TonB, partial [Saprospiraceae bacterium]|nr:energy transducer TonB [Saprospiraceae bacterium]
KSLKDAHEYIADRTVVSQSDYKEYIHLLLQTSTTPLEAHLVNSFFNSQIKNRIVMLNINKSNKKAVLRYAIIIPMIGVFTYLLASSKFVSNLAYEGQAKSIDSIPMLPPPPPPPPLPPIPSDAKWVNNQVTANGFTYIIEGPNVGENFDLNEWSTYIESFSAKDKKVNYTRSDNPINIELDNINRSYFSKDYPIGKWKNSKLRMGEFTYDILNYDAQEDFNLDEWDAMIVEDPSRKHFSIYLQGLKNDYVRNLNGKNVQLPGIYKPEYIQTIWTNSKLTFNNIHYTIKNKEVNGVFDLRDWKFDMVHDEKNSKVDITLIEKKQDKIQSNIPPPPPPSPAKKDEIFQIVEEMPRFPGCEDLKGTILDKEECAKRRLMSYLGQNVAYPVEARNGNIQGQSVVQFTVKADGSIGDVLVLRDPGSGLGNAAKDVVMSMNNMKEKWTPGKQKGQFVNVQYTVPIKFKLADIESNDKTEDITRGIVVVGHGNPAIKPSTPPPPLPPPTAIWKNSKTVSDGREYEIIKMNVNGMIDLSKYGFNTLWKIGGNKVTIDILGLKNSSENSNSVPPPPPPPPPKEELFKIVEEMPRFPGCEELDGSIKDKEACAKEKLLQYIGNIVKYPNEAKANGIEGQAVIQFTIKKDGGIDDVEVLRDPGAGLGKAAKEAVLSMNQMPEKWIAGKERGVKVAVQYTIPVKFKLNDDKDDYSKIDASHPQKISSAQSIKGVSNLENVLIILDGKVLPQSKEDALSKIDPS